MNRGITCGSTLIMTSERKGEPVARTPSTGCIDISSTASATSFDEKPSEATISARMPARAPNPTALTNRMANSSLANECIGVQFPPVRSTASGVVQVCVSSQERKEYRDGGDEGYQFESERVNKKRAMQKGWNRAYAAARRAAYARRIAHAPMRSCCSRGCRLVPPGGRQSSIGHSSRTAHLIACPGGKDESSQFLRSKLLATPDNQRRAAVMSFLCDQVSAVLKVPPELIELDRPLAALGLDLLTAFELRNRIQAAIGATLPVGRFLHRPTPNDLASAILDQLDRPGLGELPSSHEAGSRSFFPMSIGQEALWLADRLAPDSPAYGLAMCVAIGPGGEPDHLAKAFPWSLRATSACAWRSPRTDSRAIPKFLDVNSFKMELRDARGWNEAQVRQELNRLANVPFDLERGPARAATRVAAAR